MNLILNRSGKLIETFLFHELATQVDCSEGEYNLFHYRDREQLEIDFLIERDEHALLGIEIKASSSISATDFKQLKWFRDHLAKGVPFVGLVLYTGEEIFSLGDGLWAIPIGELWH